MKSLREQFNTIFAKSQLTDQQVLCQHWFGMRDSLLELQNEIHFQLAEIEQRIKNAGCEGAFEDVKIEYGAFDSDDRYDRNMSWKEKAMYILRKFRKPMSSSEITDEIFRLEFVVGETKDAGKDRRRRIMTSVSGVLSDGTKDQVKTPAVFQRVDKINPEDDREPGRFWLAGEDEPSES